MKTKFAKGALQVFKPRKAIRRDEPLTEAQAARLSEVFDALQSKQAAPVAAKAKPVAQRQSTPAVKANTRALSANEIRDLSAKFGREVGTLMRSGVRSLVAPRV